MPEMYSSLLDVCDLYVVSELYSEYSAQVVTTDAKLGAG